MWPGFAGTAGRGDITPAQHPIDHLRRRAPWYGGWTKCVHPDQSATRETHARRCTYGHPADPLERVHDGSVVPHLRELNTRPWYIAALVSWGIALFEYLLQVPANRIGYTLFTIPQLKVMQEVITLSVFVPFALFYLKEPLKLDYLWAGLCLCAAAYFMFRGMVNVS